jgi:hypothetical protein
MMAQRNPKAQANAQRVTNPRARNSPVSDGRMIALMIAQQAVPIAAKMTDGSL